MKKLFVMAAMLMAAVGMQAQENDYPNMHIGVRAGFSMNP